MICFSKFCVATMLCLILFSTACNHKKVSDNGYVIAKLSSKDEQVKNEIFNILSKLTISATIDNTAIDYTAAIKNYYEQTEYMPIWSSNQKIKAAAKKLTTYVENAMLQGLFPADYNDEKIKNVVDILVNDSSNKQPAQKWAEADILLTNTFVGLLKDLKQGRLVSDSVSWKNDTSKYNTYFGAMLEKAKHTNNIDSLLETVQPKHDGYVQLKKGIKKFVDSMDNNNYTYVNYPYNNVKDSIAFIKSLKKRLAESGIEIESIDNEVREIENDTLPHKKINKDSLALSTAIKTYQRKVGITADGKAGAGLVKRLNSSDKQRFNSIAITLDKYKLLPAKMPERYIWVNLPAYYLKVVDSDTIALQSKIICGKQTTPTPLLTSAITDIVLYPTWTVPTSIITKDMLPGLKRNSNYLARRGLYLLNGKGAKIDAASINWGKYTKGIPYRIQQGSGDGNSLGVIKFNFDNPFSVYLHDTNQRYLFKNGVRCLSHGCVRVQDWQQLANYIIRNDSIHLPKNDSLKCNTDSLKNWMAEKRNRRIDVKNKFPLFIRYFSCELVGDKIKFFDDIYFEDRDLKQKYFATK